MVFVDLDAGWNATCGVTMADNIRCWGFGRIAPIHAKNFKGVAVGRNHTCGLRLDNTVHCWGFNSQGQRDVPTASDDSPLQFSMISSLERHSCGIEIETHKLHCWGLDNFNQVSGAPTDDTRFSKVSAGHSHTCGIVRGGSNDAQLMCWGSDSTLGVIPSEVEGRSVKDVGISGSNTCVIYDGGDADGKAVCWGTSQYGIPEQTPTDTFTSMSAGSFHVCGITTDGLAKCWGAGSPGTSGSFHFGQSTIPQEFQSLVFTDIASGQEHTCGILDTSQQSVETQVVCWGEEYDELSGNRLQIKGVRTFSPDIAYPRNVDPQHFGSGFYDNCGITDVRDLVCWGESIYAPAFVEGPFLTVDLGPTNVCAVRENGNLICWGENRYLNSSGSSPVPGSLVDSVAIVENLYNDFTFKDVDAGRNHTCGILDGATDGQIDGQVICWGYKLNGQTQPPLKIDNSPHTFKSVSAGVYQSCGLLDDSNDQSEGLALCWGAQNLLDENGDVVNTHVREARADFGQATVPSEFADVPFSSISAGRYHTCAVTEDDGAMVCWGRFELADVPAELQSLAFKSVSVMYFFSCGITDAGFVKCWGSEELTVPDSQTIFSSFNLQQHHVPEDFEETVFENVIAGGRHVCATQSNGKVLCWGADADPSTPEIDIYIGSTIINTRQAWVPPSLRGSAVVPTSGLRPTANVKILRIEPAIRSAVIRPGKPVRLSTHVFGRQDIRDDSLGDRPGITFDWQTFNPQSDEPAIFGQILEAPSNNSLRPADGSPDERRALHIAASEPGVYRIKAVLNPGTECMPARRGESKQDAVERCSAIFEITVNRISPDQPTPEPARNPEGDIPPIIVDDQGTNYDVFTPEQGGETETVRCSLRLPPGAVNNGEVIGITLAELQPHDQTIPVEDPRFISDGIQCDIKAVSSDGTSLTGYLLNSPGEICMPLPDTFRPNAVDALIASINADITLTATTSGLFLTGSDNGPKVCGTISELSTTTTVAMRVEAARGLPPTPAPQLSPAPSDIEAGGFSPNSRILVIALILGLAIATTAITTTQKHLRRKKNPR